MGIFIGTMATLLIHSLSLWAECLSAFSTDITIRHRNSPTDWKEIATWSVMNAIVVIP